MPHIMKRVASRKSLALIYLIPRHEYGRDFITIEMPHPCADYCLDIEGSISNAPMLSVQMISLSLLTTAAGGDMVTEARYSRDVYLTARYDKIGRQFLTENKKNKYQLPSFDLISKSAAACLDYFGTTHCNGRLHLLFLIFVISDIADDNAKYRHHWPPASIPVIIIFTCRSRMTSFIGTRELFGVSAFRLALDDQLPCTIEALIFATTIYFWPSARHALRYQAAISACA